MRHLSFRSLAPALFAVLLALTGATQAADPVEVKFAAGPTGTTWYAYAGALRTEMLNGLPQGSTVDILGTPMAIANTKLLTAKRTDVALIFPPVASWAERGFGPFDKKIDNIRGLVGGLDQYYQRVTVQKNSDIKSLADIKKGKLAVRIGTGPQGSLNEYIARLILAANDLSYEDIESFGGSVSRSSLSILQDQFGDGKLDMIIGITTAGHPNTSQLSITPGQRFLSLGDDAIAYLEKYGFTPATMPADLFEGQNEPVKGVGFSTSIYANADMPEEEAYQITKAIMEGRESVQRSFGSMAGWTVEGAAADENLAVPLHPGAKKYYQEAAQAQ
ncbi:MAG: TRAP transporter substrate-binding protein [Alcanivorax sp.]|nr:TRAP transporter substrate-binding protein [Alcanivorax sp.]MAY12075.1 TRAP transporter substrate-binding protein [Alcanivorax sp.]MBI56067.1 TRAP transporter substrate-binding protein [Alcanivorax sp.]MBU57839.1 TRAP transporter substrate-binding protein [Alcanivorax sp.]HCE40370.1 TRAP transporter substrate-binding protein [Alcanivorax sp.]|tara:strand:- start:15982 stop:16977 length:996 start_codon:yes stop_codon:yes gene_type:complete